MDPAQSTVQVGDVLASKYRVERVLGHGGMGVVVAARHEQLGFMVALKFMLPAASTDPVLSERFLREARAAGSLRSEHVARVTDFGTLADGAPYIVMEFLQGSDLQGVLDRAGPLPVHEAAEYVRQACKGMAEAHELGIVHRDLKPQNLFLTKRPDGTPLVKVLDFGISKLVGPDPSLSVTASSQMMGSPLYMAPEQIRSSKKVDARADIYSLGAILYQLVTGRVPVLAETLGDLFEQLFTRPTQPPTTHRPDLPPAFDAIIMRCIAMNPDERFATVVDLEAALAPFTDSRRSMPGLAAAPMEVHSAPPAAMRAPQTSDPAQAGMPATPARTQPSVLGPTTTSGAVSERIDPPPKRRTPAFVWVGAAVALLAVGGGVVLLRHGTTAPATAAITAPPPSIATSAPAASLSPIPSSSGGAPPASASASATPPPAPSSPPAATTPAPVAAAGGPSPTPQASSRGRGRPAPPTPGTPPAPRPPSPSKPPGGDPFSSPD